MFLLRQLTLPNADDAPANIGTLTLAGAGAIGNGFIYALRLFDVSGRIDIADDDTITNGNLQRCVLYEGMHEGKPKAEILCAVAEPLLPAVELVPHVARVQALRNRGDRQWLPRLVLAVDSRRARRQRQTEIPGEVFDASTTGIAEIVLHFHAEPNDFACLSCLYWEAPEEYAHERHVARSLGVSMAGVEAGYILRAAAERIAAHHHEVEAENIVGRAYDTVFKDVVCSSGRIDIGEAEQVLTPFAFIPVLAGAYLAIELIRRVARPRNDYNEWRLSPWHLPFAATRMLRKRNPRCEFCSRAELRRAAGEIWRIP